jgi:hypothetical protein
VIYGQYTTANGTALSPGILVIYHTPPVYNSNNAPLGLVIYGQYITAKGTALSPGILVIYHTPPAFLLKYKHVYIVYHIHYL